MDDFSAQSNSERLTPLWTNPVDAPLDSIRSGSAPFPEEDRAWVDEPEENRSEEAYFISPLAQIQGGIRWTTGCVVLPGARITVHRSASPSSSAFSASAGDIAPVVVFGPYTLVEEFAAIDIYLSDSSSSSSSSSSSLVLCGGYNRFKSYSHVVLVDPDRDVRTEEEEEENASHARIGVEMIGTGNVFGPHATVDLREPCEGEEKEGEGGRPPRLASSSMDPSPPSLALSGSAAGRDLLPSSASPHSEKEEEEDTVRCSWWPLRIGDFCQFGAYVHLAAPSRLHPAASSSCNGAVPPPRCVWRWWRCPTPPPPRASEKAKSGFVVHRASFLIGSPSVCAKGDGEDYPVVWVVPTGGVRSLAEVHALSPPSSTSAPAVGGGVQAGTATSTSPDRSAIQKEEERYQLEVEQMCRIYIEMYGGTQPQEFDSLG